MLLHHTNVRSECTELALRVLCPGLVVYTTSAVPKPPASTRNQTFISCSMRPALAWIAVLCAHSAAAAHIDDFPRPPHTQHAQLARWLAHTAGWGTLSTLSATGQPVGGVVSFSDGAAGNPSGRLFFYLTPMDETAQNLQRSSSCSFAIAEAQLLPNGCDGTDPEDPTCAKIAVLGDMSEVTDPHDVDAAAAALFSRHPAMQTWPQDHGFTMYELKVKEIHMLDWYGGMHIIPAADYFAAQLLPAAHASVSQQQQKQKQLKQSRMVLLRAARQLL